MAQAYTTKRGKNKLAKLGVRRDQQQNQERDLKTSINTIAPKYDGPKVRAFTSAGMISDRSSSTSRLLTDNQPASTGDTNSLGKSTSSSTICSNVGCNAIHDSTTPGSQTKLMDCAACMTVKYCSKACQLMDWRCFYLNLYAFISLKAHYRFKP